MIITTVTATPVSVPTVRPCAWSLGTTLGTTRTIVEVTTDDGLTGVGECSGALPAAVLNGRVNERLLGTSVYDLAAIRRLLHVDFNDYLSLATLETVEAFAALEIALTDITAQIAGVPVYQLLGGPVRERAPFLAYAYATNLDIANVALNDVPTLTANFARESVEQQGAERFDLKVGRHPLRIDIDTVLAVRDALGPDITFGIDANSAMGFNNARQLLLHAAEAIDWFEEPTASFTEMTQLHEEFGVNICSHCVDIEKLIHYPAITGIVGDLHMQGGLRGVMQEATLIRAIGRQFWLRSCSELGVSWAAMAHVGMASNALSQPTQGLLNWVEDDLIEGPPWWVTNGGVTPPNCPGLGVRLDRDALARAHAHYTEHGAYSYFDHP